MALHTDRAPTTTNKLDIIQTFSNTASVNIEPNYKEMLERFRNSLPESSRLRYTWNDDALYINTEDVSFGIKYHFTNYKFLLEERFNNDLIKIIDKLNISFNTIGLKEARLFGENQLSFERQIGLYLTDTAGPGIDNLLLSIYNAKTSKKLLLTIKELIDIPEYHLTELIKVI